MAREAIQATDTSRVLGTRLRPCCRSHDILRLWRPYVSRRTERQLFAMLPLYVRPSVSPRTHAETIVGLLVGRGHRLAHRIVEYV